VEGSQELSVEGIFTAPFTPEAPNGWDTLTSAFFSSVTPEEDLTNFFNGGEPRWEAVVNPRLPRIQLTESLLDRTRRRIRENKAGIELLIGPTGEGKSTALRQAAAILARDDSRTIIWRQQRDAVLDQNLIDIACAYGPGTVLASDNAQLILEQLHQLIEAGSIPSSSGLQLLLASRDTDWIRRTRELGFKLDPAQAWKSMGPLVSTKHPFGRVSETDAQKIIQSWRNLEPYPPDAIRGLSDREAAKLLVDASGSAASQHGALLGGLLAIRYTPEELRAHLVSLLESLSQDATPGDMTLADVVIILALVDVAGVDGIPSEIIARFCDINELNFRSQVANRLGEESVANYNDDIMRSRHPMISETILEIAMSNQSSFAVESAACHLLAIIADKQENNNLKGGYGQIFALGHELYKAEVPTSIGPKSRLLSIALSRKACELRPRALVNRMSLSEILRSEKQVERAIAAVWAPIAKQLLNKNGWLDWNKNSRTALGEFAVVTSLAGHELEAAILRMAALSDIYRANRLEKWRAAFILRGLSLHLSRLYLEQGEPWLADTVAEIHGCVLACFSDDLEAITLTTRILEDTGLRSKSFKTPEVFVRLLNHALARMSSFDSDYLDIALWRSRITFTDLEGFLQAICEGSNS
jgi:energy-coupling factor transporter ATP-binding protein EcfA2